MHKTLIPALLATLALLAGCGKEEAQSPARAAAFAAVADGAAARAVGSIETDSYLMTLHRAISFTPRNDALGLLKAKEGHRYVVFDVEVSNRSKQPLEMGTIMLFTRITDKNGKSYGGNLGALTAYTIDHPDPRHQDEYDALLSMEFQPGATHRAVVLGVELPRDVKELVFSVPAAADMNSDMRQLSVTLD